MIVTFVRVHGVYVDHYARVYPTFTSPMTLCGEPATPTGAYVNPNPRRGQLVTEWTRPESSAACGRPAAPTPICAKTPASTTTSFASANTKRRNRDRPTRRDQRTLEPRQLAAAPLATNLA